MKFDLKIVSILFIIFIEVIFIIRVILRPHRQPASRIAWVVVILALPIVGVFLYILFGETNIGRKRVERAQRIVDEFPKLQIPYNEEPNLKSQVPEYYEKLFSTARSISNFTTVGGNSAKLFSCSNKTIDSMVSDIDNAKETVHIIFYIWMPDNNGKKMVEALKRAAARGVKCRAMVDGLGSRLLIKSEHWQAMKDAGVHAAIALPIGNVLLRPFTGRVDLRNHRKIVVIDSEVTYCGSQNCADAEFWTKAKFAPWVDTVMRFEGPIVAQNQRIFLGDWFGYVKEDLGPLLNISAHAPKAGFSAIAFGTGPTVRYSAMPEMFESLLFSAKTEVVITTPYYVPDESLQNALCSSAFRGVDTTIVFTARNDSFIVGAASRSYYSELLDAGVKIYEYVGGVLHAKTFTVDGVITLIGSANMDRRSFELNYENNILLYDSEMTGELRDLQLHYISKSNSITREMVDMWPASRRLWNNTLAMVGPLL